MTVAADQTYPVALRLRPPTPTELKILRLAADGQTFAQITTILPNTGQGAVKRALDSLRARFGAANLPHLIHLAHRYGHLS